MFVAGSPDGIVSVSTGETGLVEIKNLLHSKPINLWQASLKTNFLMGIDGFLFTIVPKFEAVILFFLSECQRAE
jgi:hypothetical protein